MPASVKTVMVRVVLISLHPHLRMLSHGRWLTPDWRESDVSVTIIMQQEMRKLSAEADTQSRCGVTSGEECPGPETVKTINRGT